MKILWVSNIKVERGMSTTGSWLENLSYQLEEKYNLDIIYSFPSKVTSENRSVYSFSNKNVNISFFEKLIVENNIEVVHIHGTEMLHTYLVCQAAENLNVPYVISIQGLVSIICNHLKADLPEYVVKRKSLRNVLLKDNIYGLSKKYRERGKYEILSLRMCHNIIGRTTWDKAMTEEINPLANYYHCNEILRSNFYQGETWNIENIERNSIFVSQASYSLKGLHYLIEALPEVLATYPNCKVYVAGKKMSKGSNFKEKLKETYYAKYLQKMIKDKQLDDKIVYLGQLDAIQMKQQFLKSHVFTSLSTMENESNSVSEAKITGTPVIASYVGGVIDRVRNNEDGYLYQHNSPEMLAYYIKKIFSDDLEATRFSTNGKLFAKDLFDVSINADNIIKVYEKMLGEDFK